MNIAEYINRDASMETAAIILCESIENIQQALELLDFDYLSQAQPTTEKEWQQIRGAVNTVQYAV